MAETIEKSQLIDIQGLATFLDNTDQRYVKVGEGTGVTYSISKNADGEIVLSGNDGSTTKVSDANTTYGFTQNGTVLTITPSTGEPITINMGEEITSAKIISALGFTPIQASDIPTSLPASDVQSWAKTGSGINVEKSVPSDAVFTDTTYGVATNSANGLMSSTDKTQIAALQGLTDDAIAAWFN